METAKSDNKLIVATDIAKNYALESEIRRSSRNRLLRCPDPDCTAPVVKYCHGDKRLPYFSHIENDDCDYAKFDQSENEVFKNVRRTFYSHLKENGFVVTPEVKVLKHHYTHLLFEYEDHKIAVEFGSKQTTIGNVDQLNNQYDKAAIHVNWICVDHTEKYFEEDTTFFLKRYGLNDSNNKSILVVGWDGIKVSQYIYDHNDYEVDGNDVLADEYARTYCETATVDDLEFVKDELSIKGFFIRYNYWLLEKNKMLNRKIKQHNEQLENERRIREQIKQQEEERKKEIIKKDNINKEIRNKVIPNKEISKNEISTKDEYRAIEHLKNEKEHTNRAQDSLACQLNQQTTPIWNEEGTDRWIKCEICGKVALSNQFQSHGGLGHVNLGVCKECDLKSR